MQLFNWDELETQKPAKFLGKKTALTIGVFDGVHRGHQALIRKISQKAPDLVPGVVTFRENPKKTARPASFEGDITGFDEKIALLKSFGAVFGVIIDFSENFSKISGRSFLEALYRHLNPAYIALGINFHCGYRRDMNASGFKSMAEELGIMAEIVEPVMEGGFPVSSSRIRAELKAGRNDTAALLLGRPFMGMYASP
jgi:riboflavin kinase/FMN adenylyltransferase